MDAVGVHAVIGKESEFAAALRALTEAMRPTVAFIDADNTTLLPKDYCERKGLPFAPFPNAVEPVPGVLATLSRLADLGVDPVVTSGRDHQQVTELMDGVEQIAKIYGNYGATLLSGGTVYFLPPQLRAHSRCFSNFAVALRRAVIAAFSAMDPRVHQRAYRRISRWCELESAQLASWVADHLVELKATAVAVHFRPFLTLEQERAALGSEPTGPASEGFCREQLSGIAGAEHLFDVAQSLWSQGGPQIFGAMWPELRVEHHAAVLEFKGPAQKGRAVDDYLARHPQTSAALAAGDSPAGDGPMLRRIGEHLPNRALPILVGGDDRSAAATGALAYAESPVAFGAFLRWLADQRCAGRATGDAS